VVQETRLENGLTVLIRESHAAPVASCWVGYRVGTRNEGPGVTGVSHWVEHMTFKGTEEIAKGEIFRLTARHGGTNNGFTSDDFTMYYETLPAAKLDVALRIESQRMGYALFDPEETERERTVILAEREGSENNPHFRLSERMGQEMFRVHPYRWPIIGTGEDLRRITRAELWSHYRRFYAPNNAVLAVVGDVDAAETLARARDLFGPIPEQEPPPPVEAREESQREPRRVELRSPGKAGYLHVAYHAPAVGHPDCDALVMLDAILSGARSPGWSGGGYMGRSARIYQALVETRLAASAGSSFRLSLDPYIFSASLTLHDGVPRKQAEEALLRVMEDVARVPPTADELARALRQAEAQLAYSRDGVTSQAYALLHSQLLGLGTDLDARPVALRAVTPDDVARVAATYLRPENRTVGWFIPTDDGESL
jgi:zinc protease